MTDKTRYFLLTKLRRQLTDDELVILLVNDC